MAALIELRRNAAHKQNVLSVPTITFPPLVAVCEKRKMNIAGGANCSHCSQGIKSQKHVALPLLCSKDERSKKKKETLGNAQSTKRQTSTSNTGIPTHPTQMLSTHISERYSVVMCDTSSSQNTTHKARPKATRAKAFTKPL